MHNFVDGMEAVRPLSRGVSTMGSFNSTYIYVNLTLALWFLISCLPRVPSCAKVRPTSETVAGIWGIGLFGGLLCWSSFLVAKVWHMYSKWISSYRDLLCSQRCLLGLCEHQRHRKARGNWGPWSWTNGQTSCAGRWGNEDLFTDLLYIF